MAPPDPRPPSELSAEAAVRGATAKLAAAGVEGAGRDARLLVAAAMGVSQGDLILRPERPLEQTIRQRLCAMVERRCRHEPVSRILGEREFYGRRFMVSPATLDPRADSETLVEATLAIIDEEGWRERPLRLLDVGTGTGCLLLTLLAELPLATGVGTDVSGAALTVARENAKALGLTGRCEFRRQRSLQPTCGIFDILLSNPPYVPTGDIAGLAPDVRDYDPRLALDGGADGLSIYREIAAELVGVVPHGWAIFEVGAGQAAAVGEILAAATSGCPRDLRVMQDLDGHQRCVAIRTHK